MAKLRSETKSRVNEGEFEIEFSKLSEEYKKIDIGSTVKSDLLEYTIRKGQIKNVKYKNNNVPNITPLIAKISVFFLHYFLPLDLTYSIFQLDTLKKHARYGSTIPDFFINPCAISQEEFYEKTHAVAVHIIGTSILLDVTFFGSVNWRILLDTPNVIEFIKIDNEEINDLAFILDFRDQNKRKKYFAAKPIDSDKYNYSLITA